MSKNTHTQSKRGEESGNSRNEADSGELMPRAARSAKKEENERGREVSLVASTSSGKPVIRSITQPICKVVSLERHMYRSRSPKSSKNKDEGAWDSELGASTMVSSSSESESGREEERDKKRKRGRPAKDPSHEGMFTAEALNERRREEKMRKQEANEDRALDPTVTPRLGPKLRKARMEEQEMLLEFREISPAGLTAIVTEHVALVRKVAQNCTKLKRTTIKALWDATISISAASAVLNLRAQSSGHTVAVPEWEELREEVRQLREDMTHLRAENNSLKKELKKERDEREKLEREKAERMRKGETEETVPQDGRSSPRQLRPRKEITAAQSRRLVDSSEEEGEGMEAGNGEEMPLEPALPPPDPASRLLLGEVIPSAYRPPLKGIRAEIEPPRQYEGPKVLTVSDLNAALEVLLPQLITRMGLATETSVDTKAPSPGPNPGSAPPVTGERSSAWGQENGLPPLPQRPSPEMVAGVDQSPSAASTGAGGNKKRRGGGKGRKKGAAAPPASPTSSSSPATPAPRPPAPPREEQWSLVVGRRQKGKGGQPSGSASVGQSGRDQISQPPSGRKGTRRERSGQSAQS